MVEYKTRKIEFKELVEVGDWRVKIYMISPTGIFNSPVFYENVLAQLPAWLNMKNGFNDVNFKVAFLILHPGAEGIFSVMNWWTGGYMRNMNIFLTDPLKPSEFEKISGDGLSPCHWELEIIYHESNSWIKHILKPRSTANIDSYLKDVINIQI